MQVKAVGHRLVIKPFTIEENDPVYKRAGLAGIELPEFSARKEQVAVDKGTVIEIGPTAFTALNPPGNDIPWCKVGDIIGYTRNAGKLIQVDDKAHVLVINDEDVVNLFKED
jgi:co-chaperonin GroES (HSP10)